MSFFTCTDFGESTRAAIVKKLFDRYDELYVEWLVGTHGDLDLGSVIHRDTCVNNTWYEAETLCRVFSADLLFTWFDRITVHRWLYDRHGMTELPKRKTIHHPVVVSFQRARTYQMHGPSGEVEHVGEIFDSNSDNSIDSDSDNSFGSDSEDIPHLEPQNQAFINNITGKRTVERAPRRSERLKKQREFYYGF